VTPLVLQMMSAAKKIQRLYQSKASLTDCCQFVYVRIASGDWLPLNLRFVIVADYPLKVGTGQITVVAFASQSRKISESPVRPWYMSKS